MTPDAAGMDVSPDDGTVTGRFARALDLSDPDVLEAARVPGRVHTAVGRVGLAHDARHAPRLSRAVLLVHDDAGAREMLRGVLEAADLDVIAVSTAGEARLRLSPRRAPPPPSVVVCDYLLGSYTARAVLHDLPRQHRALVVSAHPDTAHIAKEMRPYAGFLPSPLPDDAAGLAAFVERVVALLDDVTPEEE